MASQPALKSTSILAVAVLAAIGIGVGSVAAAGQAPLSGHATTGSSASTAHAHTAGAPGVGGPVPGKGQPVAGAKGICGSIGTITGGVLARTVGLPQNRPSFSFPAVDSFLGAAAAQGDARAICSMTLIEAGAVTSCPADLGIGYTLDFALATTTVEVTIGATGCETVGGDIAPRFFAPEAVWHTIGVSIGLGGATHATFAGRIRGVTPGASILPG